MSGTDNWLVHDHAEHEELLAKCQEAVELEDWETADSAFRELSAEIKWHMTQEEEVVFPAYEAGVGDTGGPTAALHHEHVKILDFIKDTQQVFKSRNSEAVLDCLERLEQLMIKHHEKEEDIFLPMAGRILKDNRDELLKKMSDFAASKRNE